MDHVTFTFLKPKPPQRSSLRVESTRFERAFDRGISGVHFGADSVTVDAVVMSVGRRPLSDGLDLAGTAVEVDPRGYVVVDELMRTGEAGGYAVGGTSTYSALASQRLGLHAAMVTAAEPAYLDAVRETVRSYIAVGATHLILNLVAPYPEGIVRRLADEVAGPLRAEHEGGAPS